MLRLLLPSIIGLVFFILTLCFGYLMILKHSTIEQEMLQKIKKIFFSIALLVLLFFVFYVINIVSVNEIPRAAPDRSAQEEGKQNFEERLLKDTLTIKNK
jgi:amino acid permease